MRRTRVATSPWRRVPFSWMSKRAAPILPKAVELPVAVTVNMPLPLVTSVPENTNGVSSPPGGAICVSTTPAHRFETARDSPVRTDSSTWRLEAIYRMPSAGIRSPSPNTTTSPQTTSWLASTMRFPSRITVVRGLERSLSASSARSVFCSCTIVMPRINTTPDNKRVASCGSPRMR